MKRVNRSRLWQCWRDPVFLTCAAISLVIIVFMPYWQQLWSPAVTAWQHPIATAPAVTAFVLFWFTAHMFEVTWLAYDSFYWGVPHRLAWGLAVYVFGGPVLLAYTRSRTRRRRLQLQLQVRERVGT
jgi:hypothetical protein